MRGAVAVALIASALVGLAAARASWRTALDMIHTASLPPPVEPRPAREASELRGRRVVVVDASDTAREGVRVVDRARIARVVRRLTEAGVWAIGLDIFFEEAKDPATDAELADALRASGRAVLATRYGSDRRELKPVLTPAAGALGIAHLPVDPDGTLRLIQHYYEQPGVDTRISLPLALVAMSLAPRGAGAFEVRALADRIEVRSAGGGTIDVPAGDDGLTLIHYLGGAGSVPIVRWDTLLAWPPGDPFLRGALALIGNARTDTHDSFLLPFHRDALARISGVEIHAHNAAGLLAGRKRRRATIALELALAVVAALVVLAAARRGPLTALVFVLVVSAGTLAGAVRAFDATGVLASPLGPIAAAGLAALIAPRRAAALDATTARAVDQALALLAEGRAVRAVELLQERLAGAGEPVPARLSWALALALAQQRELELAFQHLAAMDASALPLTDLDRLARTLADQGALPEAADLLRKIRSRQLDFGDVAERLTALEARDREVPERLRRVLGARYSDLALVGSGGMGRVYRAWDRKAKCAVAIKVPDEGLSQIVELQRRFVREASAIANLDHPNIVRVIEFSRRDPLYYAMELIEGETLHDIMKRGERLPEARVRALFEPIASALAAVHQIGIVHRDLKPENVLVDGAGAPRLVDFGLAYLTDGTRFTRTDVQVGTPLYMAPEMMTGAEPTFAVDVYAFGVMVFEALSGRPPFPGGAASETRPVAPPLQQLVPGVSPAIAVLVSECLAIDPSARPQSGAELHARLKQGQEASS